MGYEQSIAGKLFNALVTALWVIFVLASLPLLFIL